MDGSHGLKRTLKHYSKVYGLSVYTIRAYREKGYPLDDEQATRALIACQKYQQQGQPVPEIGAGIRLCTGSTSSFGFVVSRHTRFSSSPFSHIAAKVNGSLSLPVNRCGTLPLPTFFHS